MSKKKNLTPKDQSNLASVLDQQDAKLIVGQPGYRTRRGRSGLDYIESQAEFGHSLGTLIRRLLSGRLRVRSPFYLFSLGILGLLLCLPGFLWLVELFNNPLNSLSNFTRGSGFHSPGFSAVTGGLTGWIIVGLSSVVGVLLLVNVGRNLYRKQKSHHRR